MGRVPASPSGSAQDSAKRRMSSRPDGTSHPPPSDKRARSSIAGSSSTRSSPKDMDGDARLDHERYEFTQASGSGNRGRGSSSLRSDTYKPDRPSSAGSHTSSGSADTALEDEDMRAPRIPRIREPVKSIQSGPSTSRLPDTSPRGLSNHRWITESDKPASQFQSSSTSSTSSSNHHPAARPEDTSQRESSPPPSLTLSTGQPLVNPPPKTQAAFVGKLYSMLEDEEIRKTGLLHWSNGGSTFTCPNPTEFSKTVLPRFFKHNNWQSFVRQLNMYSFNKVNDLYATSTDPMAWEFRHPLFRQGEPHLLASIKRKTTRTSHTDGPPMLSPTDEIGDPMRPVAGWMRDDPSSLHPVADGSSPPSRQTRPPVTVRSEVFGYNLKTGEMIQARPYETTARPSSKAYAADLTRASRAASASSTAVPDGGGPSTSASTSSRRFHPDSDRPILSSAPGRDRRPGVPPPRTSTTPAPVSAPSAEYSDSAQYPQPVIQSPSPVAALANQVVYLEDRLARLSEVVVAERIENARVQLDLATFIASIVVRSPGAPNPDLAAWQGVVERQLAESRHKYEALMANDQLGRSSARDLTQDPIYDPRTQPDIAPSHRDPPPHTHTYAYSYGPRPHTDPIDHLPSRPFYDRPPSAHPAYTSSYTTTPQDHQIISPTAYSPQSAYSAAPPSKLLDGNGGFPSYPSSSMRSHSGVDGYGPLSPVPRMQPNPQPNVSILPPPPPPAPIPHVISNYYSGSSAESPFSRSPLIRSTSNLPAGPSKNPRDDMQSRHVDLNDESDPRYDYSQIDGDERGTERGRATRHVDGYADGSLTPREMEEVPKVINNRQTTGVAGLVWVKSGGGEVGTGATAHPKSTGSAVHSPMSSPAPAPAGMRNLLN